MIREKFGIHQKPIPGPDDHTNAMALWAAQDAIARAREAGWPDVDPAQHVDEHVPEGDRTDEIGGDAEKDGDGHAAILGLLSSGVKVGGDTISAMADDIRIGADTGGTQ